LSKAAFTTPYTRFFHLTFYPVCLIKGYKKLKKEAKMDMIGRFFQHAEQSFFLFGPRGTGKSTWVHRHLPNSFVIDLLAPDV
jgi:hypothetical protein